MPIELKRELSEQDLTNFSENAADYIVGTLTAMHNHEGKDFAESDLEGIKQVVKEYEKLQDEKFKKIFKDALQLVADYATHVGDTDDMTKIRVPLNLLAEKICKGLTEEEFEEKVKEALKA